MPTGDSMTGLTEGCILCLGFFDGVHLGHRELIQRACELRENTGLPVFVHTFLVSPMSVLTGKEPMCLTDNKRKEQLLLSYGADRVIFSAFDETIRDLSGRDYFERFLLKELHCRWIVAGEDHRFGLNGDTGAAELKSLCREHGVGLSLIPSVCTEDGVRISSTAIREALQIKNIALAEKMLGRAVDMTDPDHPNL